MPGRGFARAGARNQRLDPHHPHQPLHPLAVDPTAFFVELKSRERTIALVETVLSLGRIFGMSVLAEGIETDDQLALLSDTGCEEVQGYLFGRPKSLEEIIDAGELSQTAGDRAEVSL